MPPNSFMEWVVGQNVIKKKNDSKPSETRRTVFQVELETDDKAETDTIKVTYPRTGGPSSKRAGGSSSIQQPSKHHSSHHHSYKQPPSGYQPPTQPAYGQQAYEQPTPVQPTYVDPSYGQPTQPKAHITVPPAQDSRKTGVEKTDAQVNPRPRAPVDITSNLDTSGYRKSTKEETSGCACDNCIEARKSKNAKEMELSSSSSDESAAKVHKRHKAKLAQKTESEKPKPSTKKHRHKSKSKAKKHKKSNSKAETSETTVTEYETETETETEVETETELETETETNEDSEAATESEEEEVPKEKGAEKSKARKKIPKKVTKKTKKGTSRGKEKKSKRESAKGQKKANKDEEKPKEVAATLDDDDLAFNIIMQYNREKQREREKQIKAKAEEEKAIKEKAEAEAKAKIEAEAKAKAEAEAEAKAKAEAEAKAEKQLPPHNPRLENRHVNFILPSKSHVLHVEHAIENVNDPRPNAFYDNRNSVMRVYHGPAYGNPNGILYPQKIYDNQNQQLPIGTPHPLENPYYNGFPSAPQVGQSTSRPPPHTSQPRQPSPQFPTSQAREWYQESGSIPIGKVPNFAEDFDQENYERELRIANQLASPKSKNSDRAGKSNVAPAVTDKNTKPRDAQSVHGSQKGSGSKDGNYKGGNKKKGKVSVRDKLRQTIDEERDEFAEKNKEASNKADSPNNNDKHSSAGGSWGGGNWGEGDWGGGGSANNDQNGAWEAGSAPPPVDGPVNEWAGGGSDRGSVKNGSNPTLHNGSNGSRKSSGSSKAGSTHSPTRRQTIPGGWVSPTKSNYSTRSRPPGTSPDNVAPDLTSSKKTPEDKSNNNADDRRAGNRKAKKNKGKTAWGDSGVAQSSGGVFDEEDNDDKEWTGKTGHDVWGQTEW